jgi:hypothetical protein
MGWARIVVSEQLILDALHFPRGTVMRHVGMCLEHGYVDVELHVAHPDLPMAKEGQTPRAMPKFEQRDGVVLLVDWGLH